MANKKHKNQPKYYITKLIKTCSACPTQWEGRDKLGHTIYIRYRHDRLTVSRSPQCTDRIREAVCGPNVLAVDVPTQSAWMTFEEMQKITESVLIFSKEVCGGQNTDNSQKE